MESGHGVLTEKEIDDSNHNHNKKTNLYIPGSFRPAENTFQAFAPELYGFIYAIFIGCHGRILTQF
jgi:hypothetical protein